MSTTFITQQFASIDDSTTSEIFLKALGKLVREHRWAMLGGETKVAEHIHCGNCDFTTPTLDGMDSHIHI